MPSHRVLVIVTGPPAAGKSTVARLLSHASRIPLLEMDAIKEALFDHSSATTRDEPERLGVAAFAVMLRLAKDMVETSGAAIIESAMDSRMADEVSGLIEFTRCDAVQILVTARPELRLGRHRARLGSVNRHATHRLSDAAEVADWVARGVPTPEALKLECPLISVDTSDPEFDPAEVLASVGRYLMLPNTWPADADRPQTRP